MQEAPYSMAGDAAAEPLAEPSESFSRPAAVQNSVTEQTVASAVPPILLLPSESLEEPLEPPTQGYPSLRRSHFSKDSLYQENLDLDAHAIGEFSDDVEIPKSIRCTFRITYDGYNATETSDIIAYMEPNSFQTVEEIALDHASQAFSGALAAKQIYFRYGNCTVKGGHVDQIGLPLTTREEWESVCTTLVKIWRSDPRCALHVEIFRDYYSYRSRATSEVSLAATKRQEIHKLIKWVSQKEWYIPRTALMRFNSPQNIREIITQDTRLDMGPLDKEEFIKRVQSDAPCLLALCVYASLKMECLNVLLQKGFRDTALPWQPQDCCHSKCGPNFSNLLTTRGRFQAARFDNLGEHQNFDDSVVIPIQYIPVEEDQDEAMEAGRRRDQESRKGNTPRAIDDAKQRACCGSGAYSEVYRVRIDPEHRGFLKNKDAADFALKIFRDRAYREDDDFQRELKVLDELRKYPLRHIVRHLATWTKEGRYYMLFPYAQCNLREYMKWIPFGAPKKGNIIWLLRQFRGLAEALKGIHDLSGAGALPSAQNLVTRPGGERMAGYHHDLKPDNMLFFKATRDFEISDFGSGKVQAYRSGSHNTPSFRGTPTYEPPETAMEGAKASRPYDIWSLGCVFLEILIWAVLGLASVEEFRTNRVDYRCLGPNTIPLMDDAFWQMLENGDIKIRKSVENSIKTLRVAILQQRNQPFKEVLDLVVKMLDVNKETRIVALDLFDTLDRIYEQKKIDLVNVNSDSLPDNNDAQERPPHLVRLDLNPPNRCSPEKARESAPINFRNSGTFTGDLLHSHGGSRSRKTSIASSNMSTHTRHGSHDDRD